MWEGLVALPFVLEEMVILVHKARGVRERALTLFAGRARRAIGIAAEVEILITSSRELQALNRRFRKQDKPTDVLSFPSPEPRLAGNIAISADIAKSNAVELGHSAEAELKILILHGLLHLAGYDHETDNGKMKARETELRQQLKLPTGLIERAYGAKLQPARKGGKRSAERKRWGVRT